MNKIYFATTNKGKIASMNRDLEGVVEVVPVGIDIPEPRSDDTDIIARQKALYAFERINKPCIAQDGGFYIHSLNGFPKAFVNFAMETIGTEGVLRLVAGKDRLCEFRDTLAYMDNTLKEPLLFRTATKGSLADKPRGVLHKYNLGELHKIFIPDGEKKTLAEMTAGEMDHWRKTRQEDWYGRKFAKWICVGSE